MVFSSTVFLFFFLPLALILDFSTPAKGKNALLLLLSLLFYTWGEGKLVLIMLTSTAVDYWCGLQIEKGRRQMGLALSLAANLFFLFSFKYLNFTFQNLAWVLEYWQIEHSFISRIPYIALPVGISFYTFQSLSYTIDVYRGQVKAQRSFIDFAAYVTLFPQLVAGPIVRYAEIADQLRRKNLRLQEIALGAERFIIGLAKKVLIANTAAAFVDDVMGQDFQQLGTGMAWLGIVAYALQIYFDFSGYSDMAIGLGRILGFRFPENFRYPYTARSVREFWRRWHITLSFWFRDYVYISLGGNRQGFWRTQLNLLTVFFLTGLWHGASWNFIFFGLFHGLFIALERAGLRRLTAKLPAALQHFYLIVVMLLGWVFFRIEETPRLWLFMEQLFNFSAGSTAVHSYLEFYHLHPFNLLVLAAALLLCMPLYLRFSACRGRPGGLLTWRMFLLVLFLVCLLFLSVDTYNPFIYFRF